MTTTNMTKEATKIKQEKTTDFVHEETKTVSTWMDCLLSIFIICACVSTCVSIGIEQSQCEFVIATMATSLIAMGHITIHRFVSGTHSTVSIANETMKRTRGILGIIVPVRFMQYVWVYKDILAWFCILFPSLRLLFLPSSQNFIDPFLVVNLCRHLKWLV